MIHDNYEAQKPQKYKCKHENKIDFKTAINQRLLEYNPINPKVRNDKGSNNG